MPTTITRNHNPRVLPGVGCGSSQPVILAYLTIAPGAHQDWRTVSERIACATGIVANDMGPMPQNEQVLAARLLEILFQLYERTQTPVFTSGTVLYRGVTRAGTRVLAVIPYIKSRATLWVLDWLIAIVNGVNSEPSEGHSDKAWEVLRAPNPQGLNAYYFFKAAHELKIQVRRVHDEVYRFGTGPEAILLNSSFTDKTPVIGTSLARNKIATGKVLAQLGLPTATQGLAGNEDDAVTLASKIGYPVVIKPLDLDQGIAVAADLNDEAAVRLACREVLQHTKGILVENYFPGVDYRLTVFNGHVVKVVVRRPGGVVGDGLHSIAELVGLTQQDVEQQRRSRERGDRELLTLDAEALDLLDRQGLTPECIVESERFVKLRRNANVSRGGTPVLYDGVVHPDNIRLAVRAAEALKLDIAGIDIIMADIARSWFDVGAIVCEVNACPQIGAGSTPGIYRDILGQLLPGQAPAPLTVVLSGDSSSSLFDAVVAGVGDLSGACGVSSPKGIWCGSEKLAGPQPNGFTAASILLAQPAIDCGVIQLTVRDVLTAGLPFDRCELLVLDDLDLRTELPIAAVLECLQIVAPHVSGQILGRKARQPEAVTRFLKGTGCFSFVADNNDGEASIVAAVKSQLPVMLRRS